MHELTRTRPAWLIGMLVAITVALFGVGLVAPSAAHAAPNPPPKNNGEWDGTNFGQSGTTFTVLEMPNAHLFSAGWSYARVTNPGNNQQVAWSGPAGATDFVVRDAALQANGDIIVVGQKDSNTAFVDRLIYDNTTLVSDPTFAAAAPSFNHINGSDLAAVSVNADDSILVGGGFETVYVDPTTYDICGLAKLTSGGALQTNWTAGTGAACGDLGAVSGMDVNRTTGDIYVMGGVNVGVTPDTSVRKYSSAGAFNSAFNTNLTNFTSFYNTYSNPAIRVLSNGQVLIGADGGSSPTISSYRLNADGTNDGAYIGAYITNSHIANFWELSSGKYLVSGPTSVQRVNANGSIDTTWTCGGTPGSDGCGSSNNYPFGASEGESWDAIELKNGKILVGHQYGYFRLIAVGKPKITDVSSGGHKIIKIESYADEDGTTEVGGGGTKLLGFVIQYNNAARIGQSKPNVIWARFIKPPDPGTSTRIVDLSDNQAVATCQTNLIVVGKPNPSCFRNAEIDNNLVSPRTYTAYTMFQDNGSYPLSNFSIYSPGIASNQLVIVP